MSLPEGPRRIVVTGSECTGKTTLAAQLARHLGASWSMEYARIYADSVGRPLSSDDVELIARGQAAIEDAAIAEGRTTVVHDTDLQSTCVYAAHYYGHCPPWLDRLARERPADLYLLCLPDLPWIADGVRDQPQARREIHEKFVARLRGVDALVAEISGSGAARFESALAAVEAADLFAE